MNPTDWSVVEPDDMPEPRPGTRYRDVAVFLLVVVPLVAFAAGVTLLGLATVRHYEENPSE
jgi:hypothetical protein